MFEEGLVLSIGYERSPSPPTPMESCVGDEMNPPKVNLVSSMDLSPGKTPKLENILLPLLVFGIKVKVFIKMHPHLDSQC